MIYILTALIFCGLDQLVKLWTVNNIALGESVAFIPGVLGLTYYRNTGMAFSLLSEHTWLLAALSVTAIPVLAFLICKKKWFTKAERWCIALALGGVIGNAIDRVFRGYVVDMLHFQFWPSYPTFNVADMCIVCGAILGAVYYVLIYEKHDGRKPDGTADPTGSR